MIVYHVDRTATLYPEQTLNLIKSTTPQDVFLFCDNSFSQHGLSYLNEYSDCAVWEICLEYVRANYFPRFPSRYQCVFGSKTLENAKRWEKHLLTEQNIQSKIFKIECKEFYEFDANWITNPSSIPCDDAFFKPISIARLLEFSYKYWSQEMTSNPFPEVIVPLPAKVIGLV